MPSLESKARRRKKMPSRQPKGGHKFRVNIAGTMQPPGAIRPVPFKARIRVRASTQSPAELRRSIDARLPRTARVTRVSKEK